MIRRRPLARVACALLALAGGLALAPAAHAQAFPSRPIRLVVPFPAGSATDSIARVVGASVAPSIGQPVLVENRR